MGVLRKVGKRYCPSIVSQTDWPVGIGRKHFQYISDLQRIELPARPNIVLVDDFIGTGDTVTKSWDNVRSQLPNDVSLYFAALLGYKTGKAAIESKTDLVVVLNKELDERHQVFAPESIQFSEEEKEILRSYCEKADDEPEGYGKTQAMVVFYYRSPNNIISILRSTAKNWRGIFPRFV